MKCELGYQMKRMHQQMRFFWKAWGFDLEFSEVVCWFFLSWSCHQCVALCSVLFVFDCFWLLFVFFFASYFKLFLRRHSDVERCLLGNWMSSTKQLRLANLVIRLLLFFGCLVIVVKWSAPLVIKFIYYLICRQIVFERLQASLCAILTAAMTMTMTMIVKMRMEMRSNKGKVCILIFCFCCCCCVLCTRCRCILRIFSFAICFHFPPFRSSDFKFAGRTGWYWWWRWRRILFNQLVAQSVPRNLEAGISEMEWFMEDDCVSFRKKLWNIAKFDPK